MNVHVFQLEKSIATMRIVWCGQQCKQDVNSGNHKCQYRGNTVASGGGCYLPCIAMVTLHIGAKSLFVIMGWKLVLTSFRSGSYYLMMVFHLQIAVLVIEPGFSKEIRNLIQQFKKRSSSA